MTVYTDKVVLELDAKMARYHADLLAGQRKFDQVMGKMQQQLQNTESKSVAAFSRMTTALTAIGGALGVAELIRYADAWTVAGNKIAASASITGIQARNLDDLVKIANDSRSSLSDTADLYAKLMRAASGVVGSEQDLADATTIINKAFKAGGAAASEQAAGILQLSQALGSGVLQGDELRSLRENAPLLAQAIADEFNTTIAGLKKLGEDGALTSDRVFQAILKARDKIEGAFNSTNVTIGESFTRLSNSVLQYIGHVNEGTGASSLLVGALGLLSDNFELVANTAAITAGLLLSQYVPSLVRATTAQVAMIATNPFLLLATAIGVAAGYLATFSDEITVVQGDVARLNDYFGVAWDTLIEKTNEAKSQVADAFQGLVELMTKAIEGVGLSWEEVVGFIKDAGNRIIGTIDTVNTVSIALLKSLPAAVAEGIIASMQLMVDLVEAGLNKVVDGVNKVITALKEIPGLGSQIGDTFGPVDLGEIPNPLKGTARELGNTITDAVEKGLTYDYIGAGAKAATDFAQGWRDKANARAATRIVNQQQEAINDLLAPPGESPPGALPPGGSSGKGSKGRKGSSSGYDFDKELKELSQRTEALKAETAALAELDPYAEDYKTQVTKIRTEQELLNKAAKEGIALSPTQRAAISAMADAYAQADEQARNLQETQDKAQQRLQEWKDTQKDAMKGFIKDLASGKDAMDALADAVGKLADKLLDIALDNLFGASGSSGSGGILGAIFSGIAGLGKRAGGGTAQRGTPYLVNEDTPNSEVFVPSQNGGVLNVPQAQDALARAVSNSSRLGSGSQVQPSTSTMVVKTEGNFTFNLEGANGDAAIEAAVNRGIRQAAPILQNQAVAAAVKKVGQVSRTGTKSYLGV